MGEIRLNEQQLAAVKADAERPVMVVASPGSGKTAVLTLRVAHLIAECRAAPSRMVVTTFTRRAAEEMKDRLRPLIGDAVADLQLGTIHSVCLRILREEKQARDVISDYEQKKIVQEVVGYKRLNWDVGWRYPFAWAQKAKGAMIAPRESQEWFLAKLEPLTGNRWQAMDLAQKLAYVYREYEQEKRYLNKMDFLDMLVWVAQPLQGDAMFRARWQAKVEYVLVDEVQDTSGLAYGILRQLASPEDRFFAVGDPDQLLFRWAGADPDHNVFGFRDMFPDSSVLPLEVNYRSTKRIVELANRAIRENYRDASMGRALVKKTLRPRPDAPEGKPVAVTQYADVADEAKGVCEAIKGMLEEGRQPQDVFVIYRVNSQSRAIEDELLKANVPYVVQGNFGFYDRRVVKDMLAYLALVEDENDNEAFERVCNIATKDFFRPTRGFGSRWMQECMALAKGHRTSYWAAMLLMKPRLPRWQQDAVTDLVNMVEGIRERSGKDPRQALAMIRAECYEPYLLRSEGMDEQMAQDEGLFEDLDELGYATTQFKSINEYLAHVAEMKELQRQRNKEQVNAVVLTTIHRVKGLERPIVFGIGVAENILPHRMAIGGGQKEGELPVENLSGVEDERCAAFVLVSRAKEELFLSYPAMYRNAETTPSRFLFEMELLKAEASKAVDEADVGLGAQNLTPLGAGATLPVAVES